MNRRYPRGIWYEESARRFRVRMYRNGVAYLMGYFPTLELALAALERLKEHLKGIPKLPRNYVKQARLPTFVDLSQQLQEDVAPRLS